MKINEYLLILYRFLVCMIFYSLLRVAFYLFNTDIFESTEFGDWPLMIYGGWRFDTSALAYLFMAYIIVYILLFKKKYEIWGRRLYDGIFFLINGIGILLNCIDFVYYRYILRRTTFNVIDIIGNEENLGSLFWQFLIDFWYVAVFFILFFALFVWVILLVKPRESKVEGKWKYIGGGGSIIGLYWLICYRSSWWSLYFSSIRNKWCCRIYENDQSNGNSYKYAFFNNSNNG